MASASGCVICAARKKARSTVLRLALDAREKHSGCPLRATEHISHTKKHCLRHPPTTTILFFACMFACLTGRVIVYLIELAKETYPRMIR